MGGGSYDFFMQKYEEQKKQCNQDVNCTKTEFLKLIQSNYQVDFIDWQNNYYLLKNNISAQDDITTYIDNYNKTYKTVLKSINDLENEINSLEDLIKIQQKNSNNYSDILTKRNTIIKSNESNINKYSNNLNNLDNNLNDKKQNIIYFLGFIPLNPYPMTIKEVLRFYQFINIILLLILIFFIKVLKEFR